MSGGWGTSDSALLVGEHPEKRGKVALMLQINGDVFVVAEFVSTEAAGHTEGWINTAFASSREMNQALLERAQEHGLLTPEEVRG